MSEAESIKNNSVYTRLGYGVLDVAIGGKWFVCDDVVGHTHIGYPEQNSKYCVRRLLAILGKRFPTQEASLIWNEIEKYRDYIARTYGPPDSGGDLIDFEQAAHSWYAQYGQQFEKTWCLRSSFDFHYAHSSGHENMEGRWLRWIHPELVYFAEAGFGTFRVLEALTKIYPGDPMILLRVKAQFNRHELDLFWVKLAASLMNFKLDEAGLDQALLEIADHATFLEQTYERPVPLTEATLNYFCRLERAGLDARVIADVRPTRWSVTA